MEIIKQQSELSYLRFGSNNFIYLRDSSSNCKLTMLDYMDGIIDLRNLLASKQRMDEALTASRILVHINVSDIKLKDFIHKNYEVYESVQIPIGYHGKYQYHIFLRNTIGRPNGNMRASEFNQKVAPEKVKEVVTKILKQKRRKTDVVEDIVNQLKTA